MSNLRSLFGRACVLPDFLIIGAEKAGTTSLYRYLIKQPGVAHASTKEIHFFDYHHDMGPAWYRSHFPSAVRRLARRVVARPLITGEASPDYLFHPHAPLRVRALVPRVRLIALLRDPIDRAFSHYQQQVRKGRETLSFEDAVDCEFERVEEHLRALRADPSGSVHPHVTRFSYLARGRYAEQLERWLGAFDRRDLLVVKSETLFAEPAAVLPQVLDFLGLPPDVSDAALRPFENDNPGGYRDSIQASTRAKLEAYFAPHNERLCQLLGPDFRWQVPEQRRPRGVRTPRDARASHPAGSARLVRPVLH